MVGQEIKSSDELLVELKELPEKSAEIIRVMDALQKAKAKRLRRAERNLKTKANGGYK
jgi:hypothetical protein